MLDIREQSSNANVNSEKNNYTIVLYVNLITIRSIYDNRLEFSY